MFWVERGKIEVLKKLPLCTPLKTENSLISRDSYSQSTYELLTKCLKCTGQVSWEAISHEVLMRESRNSLCTILEEMKIHFLIFATRMQDTLLATHSRNTFGGVFQQNRFGFLEKLSKFQNTSDTQKHFQKQIKYSKIFLGLIIKRLSIHISH